MPEALAGLGRAYEAEGDATKAKYYRSVLLRAFPKSPIAMKAETGPADAPDARKVSGNESTAAPAEAPLDEAAPSFEEESGGQNSGAGNGTETQ